MSEIEEELSKLEDSDQTESSNVKAMLAGLRSCNDIMKSQEKVKAWAEKQMQDYENLTDDEKEKVSFLLKSSNENIEKMKKQILFLEDAIRDNQKS